VTAFLATRFDFSVFTPGGAGGSVPGGAPHP
jgi:hypothetical protein